jgi:hypothetical protein
VRRNEGGSQKEGITQLQTTEVSSCAETLNKSLITLFCTVENELHAYKPEDGMPTEARLNAVMATKIRMKSLFDLRAPSDATRILPEIGDNDIVFKEEKIESPADAENNSSPNNLSTDQGQQ